MRHSFGASIAFISAAFLSSAASAAELPAVKVSPGNAVAECATPGRLMAFLKKENPKLDGRFDGVATEYMRHGEELGLRWDYAFFQMFLETGALRYTGDVKPQQNNFAGLGATGKGARGESFPDVSTGVRAHLEHLVMYSGERVDNPVAQRTKNIQEWGVLTSWHKTIKGPMTYSQLAKQWAPGSRNYGSDIAAISGRFMQGACNDADPNPELVAEARKGRTTKGTELATAAPSKSAPSKGDELARKALDDARTEGTPRTALGGTNLAAAEAANKPAPPLSILNNDADKAATTGDAVVEQAALSTSVKAPQKSAVDGKAAAAPAAGKGCRVWTASYGGAKAVVIKAQSGETTNYTVLDVNEGSEEKEAEAYIQAYAKDGKKIAEFGNQNEALDKAFNLCPEG